MKIVKVPIDKLRGNPKNARKHPDQQVAQIAASIRDYGFNNPLLVGPDQEIIAGHGRFAAALQMKLTAVPVIYLDHLDAAHRKAYALIDNRLAEMATWDFDLLEKTINELTLEKIDLGDLNFPVGETWSSEVMPPDLEKQTLTGDGIQDAKTLIITFDDEAQRRKLFRKLDLPDDRRQYTAKDLLALLK